MKRVRACAFRCQPSLVSAHSSRPLAVSRMVSSGADMKAILSHQTITSFRSKTFSSVSALHSDLDQKSSFKELQEEQPVPRFDPSKSHSEWRQTTRSLLGDADPSAKPARPQDLIDTEEAIRYWTTQRSVEAVDTCFRLFDTLTRHLDEHPDWLTSAGELSYFYSGNYPRATHLLNAVVDAWRVQLEKQDKAKARSMFDPYRLLDKVELYASLGVPLNCRTYSIIMQASLHDKYFQEDTPIFCERLLSRMLEQPHTMPDTVAFTTAIHAWSKSKRPEAPLRAEQLFQELIHLYDNNLLQDPPNTVTYNTVLDAMCRSRQRDVLQRAHNVLTDMRTSPYPQVAPNTVSFRIVMNGWANALQMDRACALLQEMVQLYQAGNVHVQIDATFFSKLISILAKSKDRQNHERARELYQVLQRLHQETQDARFHPDELFTSRAMIIVYSKLGQADLAEALLQRLEKQALRQREMSKRAMIMPKRGHYRDVLFAWAKSQSNGAAERAERLLLRMVTMLEPEPVLVDKFTVDTVLQLWCRQSMKGQAHAAERGEELLRQLVSINEQKHMAIAKVGRSSYLHVMRSWVYMKSPHAPDRAESLLVDLLARGEKDPNMMPTREHFTAVATAWLNSKRAEAVAHISGLILDALTHEQGRRDISSDRALYGILVHALAQQGDASGAEDVLNKMVAQGRQGSKLAAPTITEFNLVLLAILRSKDDKSILQSQLKRLLHEMERLGLSPNDRTDDLLAEATLKGFDISSIQ